MATVDAITFDKPAYNPGDTIAITIGYTPDTPSVVPTPFTDTATLTDASGAVVASNSAQSVVNVPQPGDTVGNSDSGGRKWDKVSDTGTVAVFTATA